MSERSVRICVGEAPAVLSGRGEGGEARRPDELGAESASGGPPVLGEWALEDGPELDVERSFC